jgi:H+/Cl- antiporter ClcA
LDPNYAHAFSNRERALSKLKEQEGEPWFEAVFPIAGLLAVAYLLMRRKWDNENTSNFILRVAGAS